MTDQALRNRALRLFSLATMGLLLSLLLATPTSWAQTGTLFVENGNVGISESNPLFPLHIVRSDGTANIVVQETNPTVTNRSLFTIINNGGPEFSLINSNSGQAWRFHTGAGRFNVSLTGSGVDEMRLQPGGNLFISGSLTTTSTFYPDYVFEDSYELMPLSELAAYIETNGHLPNVPSADETDNGRAVNMSELQLRLLEKVEELTLYTLQQEERLEAQQAVIQRLESRIEELGAVD